jgi:CubicO group peptidase (beta-lactamase class C family)
MKRRLVTPTLLFLALAALPAAAQAPADLDRKLTEKIQATLKASTAPSASVAVVLDGKLVFAKAFGKASINPDRPATTDTRYAVGSISKQFTAAALLLLQEQGKLSIDDKVAKYFPNLTRANDVTIRQLLSHTSGYEDYAPQDYLVPAWTKPTTPMAVVEGWAQKPLNFEPGTKWQYSNTNFVLAGEIFEKVSGRKLLEFLKEKIFDPLGMTSAADWGITRPEDAASYTRFAGGPPRPVGREAVGWYFAAGELNMTPTDLSKWDVSFLNRQILSPRSYDEFTREVRLANGDTTHYALGLDLGEFNHIPTISHTGEVSGFLASNTLYPTRKAAIVVLTNEDGVSLIGPVTTQIATILFVPDEPAAAEKDTQQVRGILEGLRRGKIDRSLFTSNANQYYSELALSDAKKSLSEIGKLESVTRTSEGLRGGMTHRNYRAAFHKKTVTLNIYVMPDGKYEQFMVVE